MGEVDFTLTFFESVQAAPVFLADSEIGLAYLGDLGLGLLFCVIGGGSYVANKIKNAKNQPVKPENKNDNNVEYVENDEKVETVDNETVEQIA